MLARRPRIVFVHGSVMGGRPSWSGQRSLAEDFELEIVERPGFPPHPDVDRVDFEEHAALLAAGLPAGVHLVGHSYGGLISLLAAAAVPDRVRSLTVIEPPATGSPPEIPPLTRSPGRGPSGGRTARPVIRRRSSGASSPTSAPTTSLPRP